MSSMSSWGQSKSSDEDSGSSWEDRQKEIMEQIRLRMEQETNWLVCGVVGHPGTTKTGSCFDCRTNDEIKEGWKVLVCDIDDGAVSTWDNAWDKDPDIEIYVPNVYHYDGNPDWVNTAKNIQAWVALAEEKVKNEKVKAVVIDGMDKLSQAVNDVLRDSLLSSSQKKDMGSLIKASANVTVPPLSWGIRNDVHSSIFNKTIALDCHKFFITHVKPVYDGPNLTQDFVGYEPDWHKHVPQRLLQIVHLRKERGDGKDVYYEATLEKCKTNPKALGKTWTTFTLSETKGNDWFGIEDFRLGQFSDKHANKNENKSTD